MHFEVFGAGAGAGWLVVVDVVAVAGAVAVDGEAREWLCDQYLYPDGRFPVAIFVASGPKRK